MSMPYALTSTITNQTASIDLHGEKTDVELGENIRLRLSVVNYITNPIMYTQIIIIPPSGMSVTSTDFVKSPAGQYTSDFELEPGKGKDIEVDIISNQVGTFNITGKVVYFFGEDKNTGEYHNINLPVNVREKNISSNNISNKKISKSVFDIITKILNIISEIVKIISQINKNGNLEREN